MEEHDVSKAIEVISNGIVYNSDASFLYYNRACFYVHTGNLSMALNDLITATDLSSELEEYMKTDNEIDPLREMELYKKRFAYV